MSGGRVVSSLPSTVVAVTTAEGLRGFGEVCPLGPAYLPGFAGGVRAVLGELGPHLIGLGAANLGVLNDVMDSSVLGHGYAKSPVDIACWDVLGQLTGQPLATLLGGVRHQSFPLYMAVPLATPEEMTRYVLDRRAEGIQIFQMKIGGRPRDDEQRVAAVVAATNDDDVIIAEPTVGGAAAGYGRGSSAAAIPANLPRATMSDDRGVHSPPTADKSSHGPG